MAGHSKYSNIKHKKSLVDQKKADAFNKIPREMEVAIRMGGGADPEKNPYLKNVIKKAKSLNTPLELINRALSNHENKKPGEHKLYEGHGEYGSAFLIDCHSSNLNKTSGEIKHFFKKVGGTISAALFLFKHVIRIQMKKTSFEEMKSFFEEGENNLFFHMCDDEENEEDIVLFSNIENSRNIMNILSNKEYEHDIMYMPNSTIQLDDSQKDEIMSQASDLFKQDDTIHCIYTNIEDLTVITNDFL